MKSFKKFSPKQKKLKQVLIDIINLNKKKNATPEYAKGKMKVIKRRKVAK